MSVHTLSVLVENRPGVLTRCAGLFARRGFNIDSLAVGPTDDAARSRITIRVDCAQQSIDQVTKQLYKLVDVLKVSELGPTAVELELLMVKVSLDARAAARDHQLAEVFEARVVDVGPAAVTFACVGPPDRLRRSRSCSRRTASASWCARAGSGSTATAKSTTKANEGGGLGA